MRASSLLRASVPGLLACLWPLRAAAQWTMGIEIGAERFWGGSVERAPEHRSFRPYRPTTFGAVLERRSAKVGFGIRLHYMEAGLGLEGSDAVGAVKGVFTIYSAGPEVTYQVASLGPGNQLLVHAGPLLEVWSLIAEESRARVGAQGAISLGIPLGGRLAGSLLAGVALTPSPFNEDEVPGYDLRALWRRRFTLGLQYRL